APAVQPSELERLLEDKAHRDGDGERREVPPRQREGEDARHGPEDETDGEAPEHATIVEQGVIDLRSIEATKGNPEDGQARKDPEEKRDEEIHVRCRLPPYQATAGPGSGRHLGEGRGRSPVHLHELRRLRRGGRRKVPAVCGRVRGGAGAGGRGGGHP